MNRFNKSLERIESILKIADDWSAEDHEHYNTIIEALKIASKTLPSDDKRGKYTWSASRSDEIWRNSVCDTVLECVEEARDMGYDNNDTFAIGYVVPYEVNYVNADQLVEYLQEDAYDNVGEVTEDWLTCITKEQRDDLENRVLKVVLEWLEDCHEKPTFYSIEPFDELTLNEAVEKYCNCKK